MRYVKPVTPLVRLRDTLDAFDAPMEQLKTRRTTFTEREILEAQWNEGEDVRLREDARFWQLEGGQWHLLEQTLANDELCQRLQDGKWDGGALEDELQRLDAEMGGFHVLCPLDARLRFENGLWQLENAERLPVLDAEQIASLDAYAEPLLDEWRVQADGTPWQTMELVRQLKTLGWEVFGATEIGIVTAWLLQKSDWVRVARDLWQPRTALPRALTVQSPRVLPVRSGPSLHTSPSAPDDSSGEMEPSPEDEPENTSLPSPPVTRVGQQAATWRETLRTIHLINGYLPVPPDARFMYPNAQGIETFGALRGIWYEDASDFPMWLDRQEHRLFGPALAERIGFLETGALLQIHWDAVGVLLQVQGIDERVNEEEARLADAAALAELRGGIGESYRQSLRALLEQRPEGMTFSELYRALCTRQQHIAHRGSVQAILSLSPEFTRQERVWKLDPQRDDRSVLRRAIVLEHVSPDKPLTDLMQQVKSQLATMVPQ